MSSNHHHSVSSNQQKNEPKQQEEEQEEKDEEVITLKRLRKPIFDDSLYQKNDGTVSGSLLTVNAEEPFLCTPLDITESNLLAWLMRDSGKPSSSSSSRENNADGSNNSTSNNNDCNPNSNNERHRSKYEKRLPEHIIQGEKARYASKEAKELYKLEKDYHNRRELNRILASRLELGTATLDQDGRLLPLPNNHDNNNNNNGDGEENEERNENIPNHNEQNLEDDILFEDDHNNQAMNEEEVLVVEEEGFFPAVFGNAAQEWLDEEEERRRHIRRQEADAQEVIVNAVRKYRDDEIPEDKFFFVSIPSRAVEDNNLTFRRILVAVGCVLAAFVCVFMQAFDLIERDVIKLDPAFDKLLYDLLNVRSFGVHVKECNGLQRDDTYIIQNTYNQRRRHRKTIDCNNGVLHIPPIHILEDLDRNATVDEELIKLGLNDVFHPYRHGVNISWFHECASENPPKSTCVLQRQYPSSEEDDTGEVDQNNDTCVEVRSAVKPQLPPVACFRGVHDGMITDSEVESVLDLGALMISKGGDHLTIYNDVEQLIENIPTVVKKLESLLRTKYATPPIQPVAYQISVASPISFSASVQNAKGLNRDLYLKARNETLYKKWFNQIQMINSWPKFAIPFSVPYRDQCLIISDLEANETFAFHTSVYLGDGAGEDFSGGVTLFVDNHQSNTNPRDRIQRGVTIDGSIGRITVNSGSDDNARCRLPMRSGLRAELDIWWNCRHEIK